MPIHLSKERLPSANPECLNCGATNTPLWRSGLNGELNCNACGLYWKQHQHPRPKHMHTHHVQANDLTRLVYNKRSKGIAPQCCNCGTMITSTWRKDDEGKTVCNACRLYHKLHGYARPPSMQSGVVIRRRSRHRGGVSKTSLTKLKANCRSSPPSAITLFNDDPEFHSVDHHPTRVSPDTHQQPEIDSLGSSRTNQPGIMGEWGSRPFLTTTTVNDFFSSPTLAFNECLFHPIMGGSITEAKPMQQDAFYGSDNQYFSMFESYTR